MPLNDIPWAPIGRDRLRSSRRRRRLVMAILTAALQERSPISAIGTAYAPTNATSAVTPTVQAVVIPARVAGIQPATCAGVRGWLDAGDTGHAPGAGKPRHDKRDEASGTAHEIRQTGSHAARQGAKAAVLLDPRLQGFIAPCWSKA
jgi:hypothetical protein